MSVSDSFLVETFYEANNFIVDDSSSINVLV